MFSDVAQEGPDNVVLYFAGRHPRYLDAGPQNFLGYSAADLLETMDTVELDQVESGLGFQGVNTIDGIIASHLLDSLLAVYGSQPVVLALDAGHGGYPAVYYDPGSNGTEAVHTREVIAVLEQQATDPRYSSITIRRIFNDAIGDTFGMPPPQNRNDRAQLVIRNARASMLAYEAHEWNSRRPDAPVAVHMISVHFNANSGGTLVLHEGDDVPSDFQSHSFAFAQHYVATVRPALNASGLLPYQLGLVQGTGLHDDTLMYTSPPHPQSNNARSSTDNRPQGPPRYAILQGSLFEANFVHDLLHFHGYE